MLRFATVPTVDMDIDSLRRALFNYIVASQRGERFVVRFEDMDSGSRREEGERTVLEILELFGMGWDEIYHQSHNLTIHQHMAVKLLSAREAFACFCTPDEIASQRRAAFKAGVPYRYSGKCENLGDAEVLENEKPFTVRIKKPETPVTVDDLLRGPLSFSPEEVDSFVILETDKKSARDFATATDDMLQDISTIVCDEEDLPRSPRQIHVRNRLGYDKRVTYAHLPPLRFEKEAALSVRELLEEGFLPEAITDYLVSPASDTPGRIFSMEEALTRFDLQRLSTTPVPFELDELRAVNKEHMRRYDAKELSRAFGFADAAVGELAKCHLDEGSTIAEIRPKIEAIFSPKPYAHPRHGETIRKLKSAIETAPFFDDYRTFETHLCTETGLSQEVLAAPLRLLLTGAESGPDLSELYPHLKTYLQEIVQ